MKSNEYSIVLWHKDQSVWGPRNISSRDQAFEVLGHVAAVHTLACKGKPVLDGYVLVARRGKGRWHVVASRTTPHWDGESLPTIPGEKEQL